MGAGASFVTPRRLVLINGLLAFLIAAHVYENVVDDEHWPFCSYPMYSELEEPDTALTTYRIVGVRHDGSEAAIHKNEFIHPFDQSRLSEGLQAAHFDRARGALALNDVLHRYERRRLAGEHYGPAIVRVRFYRVKHHLAPWAANAGAPTHRELLVESDGIE